MLNRWNFLKTGFYEGIKTDLADLTDDRFALLVQAYNNTPRKCLGYNTPAEVFWNHVLHFKCESTLPPSREWRLGGLLANGAQRGPSWSV